MQTLSCSHCLRSHQRCRLRTMARRCSASLASSAFPLQKVLLHRVEGVLSIEGARVARTKEKCLGKENIRTWRYVGLFNSNLAFHACECVLLYYTKKLPLLCSRLHPTNSNVQGPSTPSTPDSISTPVTSRNLSPPRHDTLSLAVCPHPRSAQRPRVRAVCPSRLDDAMVLLLSFILPGQDLSEARCHVSSVLASQGPSPFLVQLWTWSCAVVWVPELATGSPLFGPLMPSGKQLVCSVKKTLLF